MACFLVTRPNIDAITAGGIQFPGAGPQGTRQMWQGNGGWTGLTDPPHVPVRNSFMDIQLSSESESALGKHARSPVAVASSASVLLTDRMSSASDQTGQPASHDELIESVARNRDKRAFADLFEHFAPRLKSYLMRLGTDDSAAEEVVQEAMVMVWRKAESFDRSQASASTWIFTIARNKRIDRLRRERRPELDPDDPALVPDPDVSADRAVETRQNRTRILAAMENLPEEQSELIRMAYFDEKSHAEIAAERGLPLGTVKSRIRLALARMRREVEDLG